MRNIFCILFLLGSLTSFAQESSEELKPAEKNLLEREIDRVLTSLISLGDDFSNKFKGGNPLSHLSREELSTIIDDKLGHTPIGQWSQRSPKMKSMIIDFIVDKEALPGVAQMVGNRKKLKNCLIVIILILVLSFILGLFASHKENFFERLWAKLFKWILTVCAIWGTIYGFFHEELGPAVKIISRYI